MPRRLLVATAALATAVATWAAAPADAASAYRYWQYWKVAPGASSWSFAQVGPASRPAHGTVEGWRFGVSTNSGDDTPRLAADGLFELVCPPGQPPDGQKRVAVVIDYGSTADAPPGETPPGTTVKACVTATTSATGLNILSQVATVRACSSGLIGGINGYPRTECGDGVVEPRPSPTAKPAPSATPEPTRVPAPGAAGRTSNADSRATPATSGDLATEPNPTASASGSPEAAEPAAASPAGPAPGPGTNPAENTAESVGAYATAARVPSDNGSPAGLLVTAGLLLALLGGAAYARRRAR